MKDGWTCLVTDPVVLQTAPSFPPYTLSELCYGTLYYSPPVVTTETTP